MELSYEESLRFKGVAILMMVWLHCFNNWPDPHHTYNCFIYISGEPLIYRTTYLANMVVPLYCFLSGYGLSKKYPYSISYVSKKIRNLYSQYWFVLSFFILIALFFDNNSFEISSDFLLGNYIGYNTSFNSTLWFMLPYILLLLTSVYIFKFKGKRNIYRLCLLSFLIFVLASWILKKQAEGLININLLVVLVLNYMKLLFPFILGSCANKFTVSLKFKSYVMKHKIFISFILFLLLASKLFIPSLSLSYLYLIPFVLLLHISKYPIEIHKILCYFGKYSTFIWFIHAYFVYNLFYEYMFNLSYSLVIFVSVFVVSLLLAIALRRLHLLITTVK